MLAMIRRLTWGLKGNTENFLINFVTVAAVVSDSSQTEMTKTDRVKAINLVPRAFSLAWGRGGKSQGKGPGNEVVRRLEGLVLK